MNKLPELQQLFQSAVLDSHLTPGLFIKESADTAGHFDLYVNAYRGRLADALIDNYPILHRVLGDEMFHAMAMAYIDAHPSRFRSIRWFGDQLASFIETHPDFLPHPSLVNLASMDWALRGAFDAAEAPLLLVSDLAALAPEEWPQQCFTLHPSVHLLDLQWRIEPLWQTLNQDENAEVAAPDELAHSLLVWRRGLECQWRSLEVPETTALRTVAAGKSFAEVCDTLAALGDENLTGSDPATFAASLLRQWLSDGLLVRRKEI